MPDLVLILLLIGTLAGILSELITIAMPEKILRLTEQQPELLAKQPFYQFLFILSGLYILLVSMLLFSGFGNFRIYGAVILILSVSGWVFRNIFLKYAYLLVVESTISLILLLDIVRTIIGELRL